MMTPAALQRFCATENEVRYYLQAPWREDGTIVATNGHICIEIPDDGRELKIVKGAKPPQVGKMLSKPTIGEFMPMPALVPASKAGLCKQCKGAGKHGETECAECEGNGDFEHGNYTYACARCNGSGHIGANDKQVVCLACDGFGEPQMRPSHQTVIGKATFATRYLRAFASLPGCEVSVGGPMDMAHIRFDGGRGAVMPIRPA